MEGTQVKNPETEDENLPDSSVTHLSKLTSQSESLQKIYREGDKIYHVDDENITMLKDGPIQTTSTMELESPNGDEMASGESLFKTFAFDNKISQEETEKCLSFWRSVVEKNLEPIKCTLIETVSKNHDEVEEQKKTASSKRRSRGECGPKNIVPKDPSVASSKRMVWSDILRELQKRRLHETKLLMEKRCRFCSAPPYETDDYKQQNRMMIEELDSWEPRSTKRLNTPSKTTRKSLATSTGTQKKGSRTSFQDQNIMETIQKTQDFAANTIPEEDVETINSEALFESVKEASKKIKHVDAIEMKKQSGYYSMWRKNTLEPCECQNQDCDCNTNPAIKKFLSPSVGKLEPTKSMEVKSGKDLTAQHESVLMSRTLEDHEEVEEGEIAQSEREEEDLPPKEPPKSVQLPETKEKSEEKILQKGSPMLSLSQLYKAPSGSEEDVSSKEPDKYVSLPETEEKFEKKLVQKESPMVPFSELYKEDSGQGLRKSEFYEPMDVRVKGSNPVGSKPSILHHDTSETSSKGRSGNRQSKRSFRSLSVMITCVCSKEDCDCRTVIKLPEKPPVTPSVENLPPPPSDVKAVVKKAASLDMIKKKLSTITKSPSTEGRTSEDVTKVVNLRRLSNRSNDSLEIHRRRLSFKPPRLQSDQNEEDTEIKSRNVSISL